MTSCLSTIKQRTSFAYYIVENTGGHILRTLTCGDTQCLHHNTILSDMGKTVVMNGYIYRMVQVATVDDEVSDDNQTGYICLNSDSAPLFEGNHQGISKMH